MRRVYGVLLVGLLMFIPTSGLADEAMKNPFAGDEARLPKATCSSRPCVRVTAM